MVIRKMNEQDLEQVLQIEQETFSDPWTMEDFKDSYQSENNLYLVVEEDGKILAYCGCWGVAGEGCIYNVAVHKEYRNQKIGFTMLQELITAMKGKGVSSMTLEVRKSNVSAIRLYEKLGFRSVGIRKDFYTKPLEDAVIMWLDTIQ